MRMLSFLTIAVSALALPVASFAGTIPYGNAGTVAPTTLTYATGNGGVNVYFAGSGASFTDYVEIYDPSTGFNSGQILDNHTSPLGSEVAAVGAGQINSGDQLIFYIVSPEAPDGSFPANNSLYASVPSYSADMTNHAYITPYSGTGLGNGIPAGTYVGLEDEPLGYSDFNYTDDTFVFTGVSLNTPSPTPEPSGLALLGTGILSVAGMVRRRLR